MVDVYEQLKSQPGMTGSTYWASRAGSYLVTAVQSKERSYFDACERRGFKRMWSLAYAQYFGQDPSSMSGWDTQQISFAGQDGEQVRFRINEARSMARQRIGMVTAEQAAFKCLALNTDYQSLASIETADTVVSYLYERCLPRRKEVDIVEGDEVLGFAFAWIRWDVDAGDEVTVQEPAMMPDGLTQQVDDRTGQPITVPKKKMSGAPVGSVIYPWECFGEPNSKEHLWRCVRERRSRWELMAQYPDLAEHIRGVGVLDEYAVEAFFGFDSPAATTDDVIVKHFYHKRCKALPEGRYVGIVGDIILWDSACPMSEKLPIVEMCSARFIATAMGYADFWDLLSIQQVIDQMASDIATNVELHGRPSMYYDKGTDFDVKALANGQSVFAKLQGQDPPGYVPPPQMSPIVEFALPYLHKRMESIAQLNSVVRGDPEGNITSGEMAALFHSMALEAQSPKQGALVDFRTEVANCILDLVQQNADAPFLVEVAGKDERPYLEEFTRQTLAGVKRVSVSISNAMLQSPAGRLQVWGQIKDLDDTQKAKAIEMLTTGQWKPATRQSRTCELRIRWENEQLADGKPVTVMAGDNPFRHIPEHWAEFEARCAQLETNPQALQAILGHINEHLSHFGQQNPFLCAFLGFPDAASMIMQMAGGRGPTPAMARGEEPSNRDPNGMPLPAGVSGGAPSNSSSGEAAPTQNRDRLGTKVPNPAKPPPEANVQTQQAY